MVDMTEDRCLSLSIASVEDDPSPFLGSGRVPSPSTPERGSREAWLISPILERGVSWEDATTVLSVDGDLPWCPVVSGPVQRRTRDRPA